MDTRTALQCILTSQQLVSGQGYPISNLPHRKKKKKGKAQYHPPVRRGSQFWLERVFYPSLPATPRRTFFWWEGLSPSNCLLGPPSFQKKAAIGWKSGCIWKAFGLCFLSSPSQLDLGFFGITRKSFPGNLATILSNQLNPPLATFPASFSLSFLPLLILLFSSRETIQKYPKTQNLLENEQSGMGTYSYEIDDPDVIPFLLWLRRPLAPNLKLLPFRWLLLLKPACGNLFLFKSIITHLFPSLHLYLQKVNWLPKKLHRKPSNMWTFLQLLFFLKKEKEKQKKNKKKKNKKKKKKKKKQKKKNETKPFKKWPHITPLLKIVNSLILQREN